jgi:hypothetical protein
MTPESMGPESLIGEIHPVTIDTIGSFTLSGTIEDQDNMRHRRSLIVA